MPGLEWISALRTGQIHQLVDDGALCCRCLTKPTSLRSAILTFRASAWWSVAIRCWPRSARASARRSCSRRKRNSRRSPRAGPNLPCVTPSASTTASVKPSAPKRWASIFSGS